MAKNYEAGMRITFDDKKGSVAVAFRGKLQTLPGPYASREAGVRAGEDYCRNRGWTDRTDESAGLSMLQRKK